MFGCNISVQPSSNKIPQYEVSCLCCKQHANKKYLDFNQSNFSSHIILSHIPVKLLSRPIS